jgi:hypothetical protein
MVRRESRYVLTDPQKSHIGELFSGIGVILEYRVHTVYLDDTNRSFSSTVAGSSRLRIRVYDTPVGCFGYVECKVQETPTDTRKTRWLLNSLVPGYVDAARLISPRSLSNVPGEAPWTCLAVGIVDEQCSLSISDVLGCLSFTRLSMETSFGRVTVDSGFSPEILPSGQALVEVKGDQSGPLCPPFGSGDLKPISDSKFVMYERWRRQSCV